MPPARQLKPGEKIFCLLADRGRCNYEIVYRGVTEEEQAAVLQVGVDWLSEPDEDHRDEFLLVEVNVLKRLRRKPTKAEVEVDSV